MKFLAFNLVVAAALVYLVAGDQSGKSTVSDNAVKAVSEVKQIARNAVTAGKDFVSKAPVVTAKPAPASVEAKVTPPPAPAPKLAPEVEKRRAVVLEERAVAVRNPKPVPTVVTSTNDDRRQQLLKLAEQMELFHIEAVSR